MQGFLMKNSDIAIENGEMQMISGTDLLKQTVEMVLSTNKGEWWLNPDEGITFSNILGKHNIESTESKNQTETDVSQVAELLAKRLDGVL